MADIQLIAELADSALEDWKNELPHWNWQWNNNVSRLGCCKYDMQTIFLSLPWTKKVDDDEALDTLLHELAHAIVFMRYGINAIRRDGYHGRLWQKVCVELGVIPNRLTRTDVKMSDLDVVPKWLVKCRTCGITTPYYRKPKYKIGRYICVPCKKSGNKDQLVMIQNR